MTPPARGPSTLAPPTRRRGANRPVGRRGAHDVAAVAGGLLEHVRRVADPREPRRGPRRIARPVNHRRRLLWVLAGLAVVFALLISKLTELQVLNPDHYRAFGDSQRFHSQVLAAERGAILDRNGVELAMSRPSQSIFVDPKLVADPASEAAAVAPVLGLQARDVEQRMRGDGRFAYLARKVPTEVAERVKALDLPGVAFIDESERYLPSGDLARSVIGSVDVDNAGLSGVERQYGDQLTGTPGQLTLERNPAGHTIAVGEHELVPAVPGDTLVLTLDRALQYEVERIVADQVRTTGSKGGVAIVSKPDTGEVLAIANMVREGKTDNVVSGTNNAALTTVYEPGSVMKMVTISTAIEQGLVNPQTIVSVPPSLRVGDATFEDAEPHGALSWTVTQVFAHSSNIGTIKIAQQVGKERLYSGLMAFGFGQRTAIDFLNEQHGVVPKPSAWWSTSIGTIPIGQGVSVTPMQMLAAYNVIANGGVYVPPKLVQATVDADGQTHPSEEGEKRRVLSEATSNQLNVMLRDVVAEGTGQLAAVDGYTPAGKTGTSRKPQPGGGYTDGAGVTHYQSTFVGFVPAEHPALSVLVMMDDPSGSQYTGGAVSAPAFSKIASFALRHYDIAPPATDGPRGGVSVGPPAGSDGGSPTASRPVTVLPDGRVRVLPAGEQPAPAQPPAPGASATTTTTAAPSAKKGSSTPPKKP